MLPLALAGVLAASAAIVTVSLVNDRRDLDTEVSATEKRISELRTVVQDRDQEIEDLKDRAADATESLRLCTDAAEMGAEVLTAFIDALELVSQGKEIEAQKEFVDTAHLGRQTDRTTEECISGLRALRESEAQLL